MRRLRPFALLFLVSVLLTSRIVSQASNPTQSTQQASVSGLQDKSSHVNCTNEGTYVNSDGRTVKRPEHCSTAPKGATAHCRDGTYSFSQNRRGTCSHHGGVASWF
jgi:Protein of unknown function (DUF3761)